MAMAVLVATPGLAHAADSARLAPDYDHHVHVLSPQLIAHWKSLGVTFGRPDDAYTNPGFLIDKESLRGVFLVSMAHLYATEGFESLQESPGDARRWLAAENDFIGRCVDSAPDRFVGFLSVCPASDDAFEELERCRAKQNLTGLKLHLPACGDELDDPVHMRRLAEVLGWAAKNDVPVLLLLSAGEAISSEAARRFWEETVAPQAGLELYLAHLGSAGGYNPSTREILDAYQQARQGVDGFGDRIYFDISGAVIPEGSEEASPTSNEACEQLSEHMRRIGIERFVFASDYPVFGIRDSADRLQARLSLTPNEFRRLFANPSPRFTR
jgi:predicted TIM-barrel fold metal-dependent hydrolase